MTKPIDFRYGITMANFEFEDDAAIQAQWRLTEGINLSARLLLGLICCGYLM